MNIYISKIDGIVLVIMMDVCGILYDDMYSFEFCCEMVDEYV